MHVPRDSNFIAISLLTIYQNYQTKKPVNQNIIQHGRKKGENY